MLTAKHKKTIRHIYHQLREQHPNFVPRSEQNQLIADISRCIAGSIDRKQRIMIIESGTGTGKSLAYLLSAIPLALSLNKKLIISTATVALQQQLIRLELPKVHRAMEGDFEFNLAKGRQRYCCQHKLRRLSLSPDKAKDAPLVQQLWQAYKNGQWDGERDSWPTRIPDAIWLSIQSDAFSCTPTLHRHRSCPFAKARKALTQAQVIVTNHSLLLADLDRGGGIILPPPEECIYILDEAHLLPEITRDSSLCQLTLLKSHEQLLAFKPLLEQFNQKLSSGSFIQTRLNALESQAQVCDLLKRLDEVQRAHRTQFTDGLWLLPPGKLPQTIVNLSHNYQGACQKLQRSLEQLGAQLQEALSDSVLPQAVAESWLAQLGPFQALSEQLLEMIVHCQRTPDQTPYAYWFVQTTKDTLFCSCPLEVGAKLQAILWEPAFSVVALSATLSALGRFDYFLNQAGLYQTLMKEQQKINPSPFDYQRVTLRLTQNFAPPESPLFIEQVMNYVIQNYHSSSAMLILCTSYKMVDELAKLLSERSSITFFSQGQLANQELLASFKRAVKKKGQGLLIATTGFGEGIDLPGDYLNHLVIPKLPFAVPTDPIAQSHAQLLEQKGLNPFLLLTLPQASRKLIQCCGRLMRKETDSGTIAILDSRLMTRRYGRQLINALPNYHIEYT